MSELNLGDSTYPTSKDTMTPVSDGNDYVVASHFNGLANAIVAIENELGIGLKGVLADLATRLNVNMSSQGGILYGTSFPASPPNTPHFFVRTDLARIYYYDTVQASYSELATSFSLTDYLSKTISSQITAVHQFNPTDVEPPFTLGSNAANQKVVNFNADLVDGKHAGVANGLATTDGNNRVTEAANYIFDGTANRSCAPSGPNTVPIRDSNGVLLPYYMSGEQDIISGGLLTLPHGISGVVYPQMIDVKVYLICKAIEGGYSINDIYAAPLNFALDYANYSGSPPVIVVTSFTRKMFGVSIVPDATNLNIKFSNEPSVWVIPNKSNGSAVNITNTSWKAIFVARY